MTYGFGCIKQPTACCCPGIVSLHPVGWRVLQHSQSNGICSIAYRLVVGSPEAESKVMSQSAAQIAADRMYMKVSTTAPSGKMRQCPQECCPRSSAVPADRSADGMLWQQLSASFLGHPQMLPPPPLLLYDSAAGSHLLR